MRKISPQVFFEGKSKYSFWEKGTKLFSEGEAQIELGAEALSLSPMLQEALLFQLRGIIAITQEDYQIKLEMEGGEKLVLFHLGYRFDDLFRELVKRRNEVILRDMLMQEQLQKGGLKAEITYQNHFTEHRMKETGEIRFYETALVLIPENGEVVRIPYSFIKEIKDEDYTLLINTELKEEVSFSRMGPSHDFFKRNLSEAMNRISLQTQETLKELLPGLPASQVRQASRLLKEGRAASQASLQKISPEIWNKLEKSLEKVGIKEEYQYLRSLSADPQHLYIGLKKGLAKEEAGQYLWFLIPIYQSISDKPGNAVAMEAAPLEGGGKATYFFRIIERQEYQRHRSLEELNKLAASLVERINYCMVAINFRREPIYLPWERMNEGRFLQYRHAVNKLPELRELRHLFIGRVMHFTSEQWKEDVDSLLSFNVRVKDDDLKWVKANAGIPEIEDIL